MIIVEYCRHGNLSVYLRGMRDFYVGSTLGAEKSSEGDTKKARRHSDNSSNDGVFMDDVDQRSWIEKRTSRSSYGSNADTIGSHECGETGTTRFSR